MDDDLKAPPDGGIRDAGPAVFIEDASVDDDAGWAIEDEPVETPDDDDPKEPKPRDGLGELVRVSLEFTARAGDGILACDQAVGAAGKQASAVEIRDLRFYVHDVMLIRSDGTGQPAKLAEDGPFQNGSVALLDFENGQGRCESGDAQENHLVRVGVEAGAYRGVAFRIGVPEALNHENPAEAEPPLDTLAMHWGWNDGYKFLRIDTRTQAGSSIGVHVGSTLCDFDDEKQRTVCARPNRPLIVLADMDPTQQRIVFDYAALVAELDLETDAPGCIAGGTPTTCEPVMRALGLDHATGELSDAPQSVFTVEDK